MIAISRAVVYPVAVIRSDGGYLIGRYFFSGRASHSYPACFRYRRGLVCLQPRAKSAAVGGFLGILSNLHHDRLVRKTPERGKGSFPALQELR